MVPATSRQPRTALEVHAIGSSTGSGADRSAHVVYAPSREQIARRCPRGGRVNLTWRTGASTSFARARASTPHRHAVGVHMSRTVLVPRRDVVASAHGADRHAHACSTSGPRVVTRGGAPSASLAHQVPRVRVPFGPRGMSGTADRCRHPTRPTARTAYIGWTTKRRAVRPRGDALVARRAP